MSARTIRVLHGGAREGPSCVLVRYKGFAHLRPYCNPANVVTAKLVHDEPITQPLTCPVCEHYRQRLERFWSQGGETQFPSGSDGQHA